MKLKKFSVRQHMLANNFIMILVPVLLLVILFSTVFYGLRSTGNFRDRVMELEWPEAGDKAPVMLALSHIRSHVDKARDGRLGSRKRLQMRSRSLEEAGIHVVLRSRGEIYFASDPAQAEAVERNVKQKVQTQGNALLWDDEGLFFRYANVKENAVGYAWGPVPFKIGQGYFPFDVEEALNILGTVTLLLLTLIVVLTGILLAKHASRNFVKPLEELQQSARRISSGDLSTPVPVYGTSEIGETARVLESMRGELLADRKRRELYEQKRRELLASIAHDLATPLTKIMGYTSGVLENIAGTPEKKQRYLELVLQTGRHMERLIGDLFLLSRLNMGQAEFILESVDLRKYLGEYVNDQKLGLEMENFQLAFDDSSCVGVMTAKLDRDQFRRVLDNVLTNSLKYRSGENDGLELKLEPLGGGRAKLTMTDNGRGVTEEEAPRLFESFYRTDKARGQTAKGSGLGLAITKAIVTQLGGKICARARAPHGLAIIIELPLEENHAEHSDC